jgi:urocanate hydratase
MLNLKQMQATRRLAARVPSDPEMGVVRHVEAGYEEAIEFAEKNDVKILMR